MTMAAERVGIEFGHGLIGGVGVVDVVVGKLLALHLPGGRDAGALLGRAVEGCRLVRILAVAHHLGDGAAERAEGRRRVVELGRRTSWRSPRRRRPCAHRPSARGGGAGCSVTGAVIGRQVVEHGRVIGAVHHHRHVAVVLGGGADHRRAADIDVLDAIVIGPASRHRRLERIEIDHQEVDLARCRGRSIAA